MIKKVIFVVCDGLGDRPIAKLEGKTPLEAAYTLHLDSIAVKSECGLMYTLGRGVVPGSDTAHLGLFGYNPSVYYSGRGPIEAAGIGLTLEDGDVAFRGNLGTVDKNLVILDRRVGRIRDVSPFTKEIDGIEIDGIEFIVKPGTAHRAIVVMRGKGLSSAVKDLDPHVENVRVNEAIPANTSEEAKFTCQTLNKFIAKSADILSKLDLNIERKLSGKLSANYLLLRGAGQYKSMPSFHEKYGLKACCIAGGGLYKGVAAYLGMAIINVEGANALPDTNIENKFKRAIEALESHDFIFIHVKAADSLAEDKNFLGKRDFIERIDDAAKLFINLPQDVLLIITADHSTPSELGKHSADSVPIVFKGNGVRVDQVEQFGERSCAQGNLGIIEGKDLMPQISNLMGRIPLYGA